MRDEWVTHESQGLRFQHPPDWKVFSKEVNKTSKKIWTVDPPNQETDDTGEIYISEHYDGKEKRTFDEFVAAEKKSPGVRLVNTPKQLKLKIGRCITYPRESQPGSYLATLNTHCYRDNGNYVEIWADIGRYKDNTKPDAVSIRNSLIYERVLNSIEFL